MAFSVVVISNQTDVVLFGSQGVPGDDYALRLAVDIFTKDPGIVADMVQGLKFPTPVASMAPKMFVMMAAANIGRDADDDSVALMIIGLAGLRLPGAAKPNTFSSGDWR